MTIQLRSLVLALIVVATVVLVAYGSYAYAEGRAPFGPSDDQWTGVFLTNGRAFYGHFYSAPGEYALLRNAYYLVSTEGSAQFSLRRASDDVHAPRSDMRIAKAHILYLQELRSDSPIVQAIATLRNAPPSQATPQLGTPVPTATPARSPSPSPR